MIPKDSQAITRPGSSEWVQRRLRKRRMKQVSIWVFEAAFVATGFYLIIKNML
jgi:hypothetical protein